MQVDWIETAKTLGVAAPLVLILVWILDRTTKERERITTQFLTTLQTTITTNTATQTQTVEAIKENTSALKEFSNRASDEHNRLIDAIGKSRERTT